jgi:hypothetical protein
MIEATLFAIVEPVCDAFLRHGESKKSSNNLLMNQSQHVFGWNSFTSSLGPAHQHCSWLLKCPPPGNTMCRFLAWFWGSPHRSAHGIHANANKHKSPASIVIIPPNS